MEGLAVSLIVAVGYLEGLLTITRDAGEGQKRIKRLLGTSQSLWTHGTPSVAPTVPLVSWHRNTLNGMGSCLATAADCWGGSLTSMFLSVICLWCLVHSVFVAAIGCLWG